MKNLFKVSAFALMCSMIYSCAESNIDELTSPTEANSHLKVAPGGGEEAVDPIIKPTSNGDFVKVTLANTTGEVFYMWRFENRWRHVVSPMTWDGLFTSPKSFRYSFLSFSELTTFTGIGIGSPLYADNDLKQDNYTQKIYLREGNLLRWIPNLAIYNQYKFNNSAIHPINGTAGYTIGSDIN